MTKTDFLWNRPLVKIERKDLPGFPGTVAYQITGESPELVQKEIDRLFRQIESVEGCAEFHNPARLPDGQYSARGYTWIAGGAAP